MGNAIFILNRNSTKFEIYWLSNLKVQHGTAKCANLSTNKQTIRKCVKRQHAFAIVLFQRSCSDL